MQVISLFDFQVQHFRIKKMFRGQFFNHNTPSVDKYKI